LSIDKKPVWHAGLPELPKNYAIYYSEAPVGLVPYVGAFSELGLDTEKPFAVWLEYLGGTHRPVDWGPEKTRDDPEAVLHQSDVLAATPRTRIQGSRHGVIASDVAGDRYSWIYVFHGGHKLRWKSIAGAVIEGQKVTITASDKRPGSEQTGIISVNLYDGAYSEIWSPVAQ
jgi:hypothetical protein